MKTFFLPINNIRQRLLGISKIKKKICKEKQFERLKKLKEFLTILISDLSEKLHDLIEAQNDAEKQTIIRNYF